MALALIRTHLTRLFQMHEEATLKARGRWKVAKGDQKLIASVDVESWAQGSNLIALLLKGLDEAEGTPVPVGTLPSPEYVTEAFEELAKTNGTTEGAEEPFNLDTLFRLNRSMVPEPGYTLGLWVPTDEENPAQGEIVLCHKIQPKALIWGRQEVLGVSREDASAKAIRRAEQGFTKPNPDEIDLFVWNRVVSKA